MDIIVQITEYSHLLAGITVEMAQEGRILLLKLVSRNTTI